MLIDYSSLTHSFEHSITALFRNGLEQGSKLAGRPLQTIHDFTNRLVKSNWVAGTVLVISTGIFLKLSHLFSNEVNEQTQEYFAGQSETSKNIHRFFVDGVVFGGSFTVLSYLLSRTMQYPLHPAVLAAITITAIAARTILKNHGALQSEILAHRSTQEKLDREIKKKQSGELHENEEHTAEDLEDKIGDFRTQLEKSLKNHQDTVNYLNSSLEEALSKKSNLEKALNEAKMTNLALESRLTESTIEIKQSIQTQDILSRQILDLEEAFRILTNNAKMEREELEKKIEENLTHILEIQQKLEIERQEKLMLEQKLHESSSQNEDLTAKLADAQSNEQKLKQSLVQHETKAENDIIRLEGEIEELNRLLQETDQGRGRTNSDEPTSEHHAKADEIKKTTKKGSLMRRFSFGKSAQKNEERSSSST